MKSLEILRFAFLLLALTILMVGCRFSYSGTSSGDNAEQGAQNPVASSTARLSEGDEPGRVEADDENEAANDANDAND
jgi:hypothetical protein